MSEFQLHAFISVYSSLLMLYKQIHMQVLTENSIVLIKTSIYNSSCGCNEREAMPWPAFRILLKWPCQAVQQKHTNPERCYLLTFKYVSLVD